MINTDSVDASKYPIAHWKTWAVALVAATVLTWLFFNNGTQHDADTFLNSTDDMVRLEIVREWLGGQGWYDPYLHRLGFEPGTNMHWSRLVDAPIGMLVVLGNFFSSGSGERFAAAAWPFITLIFAIAGILTAVRRATGSDNVIPSLIIGGVGVWSWGAFQTGVIDHHNVQTTLSIWLVASVLPARSQVRAFALAGILMAIMLAVGLESLPMAIAGALAIMVRLLIERDSLYDPVRAFGLSLAIGIAGLFVLLVGPQNYAQTYCDSLSLFHLVCAGFGGLLIYVTLHPSIRKLLPAPYLSAPAISGAIVVGIALVYFPQCLADPVASIDPVLRHYWLDSIMEAQNVFKVFALDPWLLIYQHALTVLALVALIYQLATNQERTINIQLLIFLTVSTAVTLFQMRGIQLSGPIAGLVLSIIVTRFMEENGKTRPIAGLVALVVCCHFFWKLIVIGGMTVLAQEPGPLMGASKVERENLCRTQEVLTTLSAEKPGFIAAANGLGPWLLLSTEHRVLAGPYHRNGSGNLAAINIMIGTEVEARTIMQQNGITLFAACPEFFDEAQILREVPNGFLGQLLGGKTPQWLVPIPETMDKDLKIWRVVPAS